MNGYCATAIRQGLEAGGLNTLGHPRYAKNYGPFLVKLGFDIVNGDDYTPQKGDIRVFESYPGQVPYAAGHIDMFNGNNWVSDFMEHNNLPGSNYIRFQTPYQIFRWNGN